MSKGNSAVLFLTLLWVDDDQEKVVTQSTVQVPVLEMQIKCKKIVNLYSTEPA